MAASALLDLLTAEEVDALADACTAAGCPALLTLSVTGSVGFFPAEPLDSVFGAAFDAHQRRTVVSESGSRRLLGPDAGATAEHAFAKRGAVTEVRSSPWRLGPGWAGREWAELTEEWLRGWIAAACAQQPDLGGLRGRLPAPPDLRQRGGRAAGRRRPPRRARPTWSTASRPRSRSTASRRYDVRGLWPLVKTAAGVGILVGLVVRLGAQAFVDGLAAIGAGSVLAALALGLLTTVASAARWCLVARGLGLRLPLAAAVSDCYRAVFLNSVLPAGVLGDVHRAVGYGRRIGDMGRGVRVVALERVTGQLAIVVVGLGVLLTARPTLLMALLPGRLGVAEVLAGLVALAAVVLWVARDPRTARIRAALRSACVDARSGVLSRSAWPGLLALSVVTLAGYLALFVVAARVAGSQAALGDLLPLLVLGLLAMALPLNIGGWGPREGVMAVAFGAVGLGAAQGLTTAVVYGVLSLIACLPGAVVLLLTATARRLPASRPTILERSPA